MIEKRSADTILKEIIHNINLGRIHLYKPNDRFDKVSLTDNGQRLINEAVKLCLSMDLAPVCSINGDDGTCGADILSINQYELDDLIIKLKTITNKKLSQ